VNVLGLNVCLDAAVPALKLPAIGRFAPTPLEIEAIARAGGWRRRLTVAFDIFERGKSGFY